MIVAGPAVRSRRGVAPDHLNEELRARMRAEIRSWTPKPAAVAVFGSAARGDGTTASDIDVLVVRDESVEAEDRSGRGTLRRSRTT